MKQLECFALSIILRWSVLVIALLIASTSGRKASTADTDQSPRGVSVQRLSSGGEPALDLPRPHESYLPTGHSGRINQPLRLESAYGKLPLSFEPNRAQASHEVKFLSRGQGSRLLLTSTEAVLQFPLADFSLLNDQVDQNHGFDLRHLPTKFVPLDFRRFATIPEEPNPYITVRNQKSKSVRMKLVGANPTAQVQGAEKLSGVTNYLIGNDPRHWHTHIPNYARVRYQNIYPGIDLVYYGNPRHLESDYVVAPGADPRMIQVAYEGTRDIRINEAGDLILDVAGMEIRQHRPRVYQEIEGSEREVAGNYVVVGKDVVGFHLEPYDVSHSVVIDPVLSYPVRNDFANISRITLDPVGNLYLCGDATVLPTTPGSFQESNPASGFGQAFVAKINATGSALVYATFLGGTDGGSGAAGVAADPLGNAYVTGGTGASDFPLANPLQPVRKGSTDFFVTKLNADGSDLVYSTYLGGSEDDGPSNISVSSSGDAYVSGATSCQDFPTVNPFQSSLKGQLDIVIFRLSAAGNALVYATYIGGSSTSNGEGLRDSTLDSNGNLYIIGQTDSGDFPLVNPLQAGLRGRSNAFVAKLKSAGNELAFSTYLGGSDYDQGTGIAIDRQDNVYITGTTTSTDFPTVNPIYPTQSNPAATDGFAAKISPDGGKLVYSSYLWGSGGSWIAVDSLGTAYLRGKDIVKLKPEGNALDSTISLQDPVPSSTGAVAMSPSDELYVARALGRVDVHELPTGGSQEVFVPIDGVISRISNQPNIDLFVPVILSAAGQQGSYFTSELTLTNRSTKDAAITFDYTAALGGGGGTATTTLLAGRQSIEPDAMEYLRALGIPIPGTGSRGGTLKVHFSGPSSASEVGVVARTTTPAGEGRVGLAYAGVAGSLTLAGTSYLFGLRQDGVDRSNVALQNTGGQQDGEVVLRLNVFSGDPGAPVSKILPDERLVPGAFRQLNGILASNGLSLSRGYIRVERVGGTAPYYAYAVINDQTGSDGSFVPPFADNALSRRDGWVVPALLETASYTSELILANPTLETRHLQLVYNPGTGQVAEITIELAPGEQRIIPSFVQYLRDQGVTGIGAAGPTFAGPLTVLDPNANAQGVFAGARTLTSGKAGRFGVFYAAQPVFKTAADLWFYGLRQDGENRSNLAIVNAGGESDSYVIDLYNGNTGQKVNTLEGLEVAAGEWFQLGAILANYAPGVHNGYAHVKRISDSNPFLAYTVINDGAAPGERTGDGAFIASSP